MKHGMLQDDKGNISSIRIILIVSFGIFIYLLALWRKAFLFEIVKDQPDYTGLVALFTAMIINTGLVLFLKVLQKKYER